MAETTPLARLLSSLVYKYVPNHQTLTTQRKLAEHLGVSNAQLSRLLDGKGSLTNKMAQRLAGRIGKTPDECEKVLAQLRKLIDLETEPDRGIVALDAIRIQRLSKGPHVITLPKDFL